MTRRTAIRFNQALPDPQSILTAESREPFTVVTPYVVAYKNGYLPLESASLAAHVMARVYDPDDLLIRPESHRETENRARDRNTHTARFCRNGDGIPYSHPFDIGFHWHPFKKNELLTENATKRGLSSQKKFVFDHSFGV